MSCAGYAVAKDAKEDKREEKRGKLGAMPVRRDGNGCTEICAVWGRRGVAVQQCRCAPVRAVHD